MTTDIIPSLNADQVTVTGMSFDDLMLLDEHYVIPGFTELDKSELLGVPLIITGVTWWMSKKIKDRDFVACEAVVGSEAALTEALKRGWMPNITNLDQLKFSPNEAVVFNDGSTGIRRQITGLCHKAHLIDVGPDYDGKDESYFDRPFTEWTAFTESRKQGDFGDVPHVSRNQNGNPFALKQLRGLSVSEYANEHTMEGVTYYLR